MKLKNASNRRSWLLASGVLLILVMAMLFLLWNKKGVGPSKIVNTAVDGVNLTYLDFDKSNQKRMEVKCRESRQYKNERMRVKKITATIFKTDKLEKDIQVAAESGIISNNLHDFEISDRARIYSSDFSLSSQSFTLKNRELLTSAEKVDYEVQNISGTAAAGLEYFLDQGILKLFETRGTLMKNGQPCAFYAQTLWVIKKSNLIIFQNKGELAGGGATVSGDWLSLQFDRDFASLQTAFVSGNCFFNMHESSEIGAAQSKEISADLIFITYDSAGRLQHISVTGSGKITLEDKKNKGRIASDKIEIYLRPESQTLEKVHVRSRGTLTNRGRDNISLSGDSLFALYSADGQLTQIKADDHCEFSTDDLKGTADFITYDVGRFLIDITGKDAAIFSKKNIFNSSHFLVHTRKRLLNSSQGVKATIWPGQKNVLLSSKPLFITASVMEMADRGHTIRFREKVKLFQDELELHAGDMFYNSRKNLMAFSENVNLKFINENELVILRGQTISFDTPGRRIMVVGNASLNHAENTLTGRQIELCFEQANRLENILARDHVTFNKKDLSGKSGSLHWSFTKNIIRFKNSAQISRKGAGTTKGRELLLNLHSNEIEVSSQEDRAETIIHSDRR
ncbi:MAG: LPS export ABC transporter periplasmic protein LptC [Candidatus Aminicenantes bacterium]|nr:LPS export ABC transporter periplasmic protein LptC [Candidatus Aminicenantes bacterium]